MLKVADAGLQVMSKARRALFADALYGAEQPAALAPAGPAPPDASWLAAASPPTVLAPGLVVVKDAVTPDQQRWLALVAMRRGREPPPRGFWVDRPAPAGPDGSSPLRREPNSSPNAGRARAYDALGAFADAEAPLRALCAALVGAARRADAAMPPMAPTHLLLVHYSRGQHVRPAIAWHKDDAPNDGKNDHPVVAVSLGESADFQLCAGWSRARQAALDAAGALHRVRLESGDAILFGGPLRYAHHAVSRVHVDSCARHLLPLLGGARLSLTFRDALGIDAAKYATFRPIAHGEAGAGARASACAMASVAGPGMCAG